MHRFVTITSSVILSLCVLSGCSGGSDPEPANKEGSKQPSGETSNGETPKEEDQSSKLGPDCTAYLACCEELAESQPALAGSCDQTKKSITDATESGASTSQYESACKQALAAAQGAGYCK